MKLNQKIRYLLDPESGMKWKYNHKFRTLVTDTLSYQDDIKLYYEYGNWNYADKFLGAIKLSFLTQMKIRKAIAGSNIGNVEHN